MYRPKLEPELGRLLYWEQGWAVSHRHRLIGWMKPAQMRDREQAKYL